MYRFFGRQIRANMERAERAGREAAQYEASLKIMELNSEIKSLRGEVETLSPAKDYVVDVRDVISARSNPDGSTSLIYLGGEQLNNQEISNLQAEVRFLRSSKLWPIITSTLKSQAQDVMFNKSQTFDDMVAGKMMLRNLDVQEKILATIEKFTNKP